MLLSNVLTRLGYGSENATWRNCFLTGAQELHHGPEAAGVSSAGMAAALTVTQLFDSLAIQLDGKRAWDSAAHRSAGTSPTAARPTAWNSATAD
jgi:alkyl sulfatase BDS1-like metallo-beta-lactamase superfamily hydrolase